MSEVEGRRRRSGSARTLLASLACAALAASARAAPPAAASAAAGRQRLEQSARHLARVRAALEDVVARAADARHEKDAARVACLDEKVARIEALLRVARGSDRAVREELAARAGPSLAHTLSPQGTGKGEGGSPIPSPREERRGARPDRAADAELAKLALARRKAEALRTESDRCLGQRAYFVEEKTSVEVIPPPESSVPR